MCGIAGIYNIDGKKVSPDIVKKMTDMLIHRGPDGEGYYLDNNIGFGHRRLSIIDLSDRAHQPMCNEDGSIWITYNGEIYNYIELREQLKKLGHKFRSDSDTEVVIHAYEEYKHDCLKYFNGMFAFAIWDKNEKRLFCARDRFGIKPFYYNYNGSRLTFASEIKALFKNDIKKEPNQKLVYDYLIYSVVDAGAETFFKGIMKLPAAHYMVISADGLTISRYWDIDQINGKRLTDEEYEQGFIDHLKSSIRLRLRSDVPVGTCLSGGVDSSAIVCLMRNILGNGDLVNKYQNSFSACFDDPQYNETKFIEIIVKSTGIKPHYVYPNGEEFNDMIEKIIWHQEEPVYDTSVFSQWCVMGLAKKNGVKVLLDGQGPDEMLAGYHHLYASYFIQLMRSMNIADLIKEVTACRNLHNYPINRLLSPLLKNLMPVSLKRLAKRNRHEWLGKDYDKHNNDVGSAGRMSKKYDDYFLNHLYDSTMHSGLPALLRFEDKNSSAFSLEARVPFLDHQLVEYAFKLPNDQKIKNGLTKTILRNAVKGYVPDEVRFRIDKMAFPSPEKRWFSSALKNKIAGIFSSRLFKNRPYFNAEKVIDNYERFVSGQGGVDSRTIWRWLNVELWLRELID